MSAEIIQAKPEHIPYIAERCRQADIDEFAALGCSPADAMLVGMQTKGLIYTGTWKGEPVCMFGVTDASLIGNVGRPWMVATSTIEKFQKSFLRKNREIIRIWLDIYSVLYNHVDVRNSQAIYWLQYLGFTMDSVEYLGINQMPFYRFSQGR